MCHHTLSSSMSNLLSWLISSSSFSSSGFGFRPKAIPILAPSCQIVVMVMAKMTIGCVWIIPIVEMAFMRPLANGSSSGFPWPSTVRTSIYKVTTVVSAKCHEDDVIYAYKHRSKLPRTYWRQGQRGWDWDWDGYGAGNGDGDRVPVSRLTSASQRIWGKCMWGKALVLEASSRSPARWNQTKQVQRGLWRDVLDQQHA